jgi:hypothetical protein
MLLPRSDPNSSMICPPVISTHVQESAACLLFEGEQYLTRCTPSKTATNALLQNEDCE